MKNNFFVLIIVVICMSYSFSSCTKDDLTLTAALVDSDSEITMDVGSENELASNLVDTDSEITLGANGEDLLNNTQEK